MLKLTTKLLTCTALALPAPLLAQTADKQPGEDAFGGLEVIVVTAQKRAEGLEDVPISISAVSGEAIEAYGDANLEQVASSIPNLKITQTAIANRIAIRGIASGDNKGFEQSVAMFVDGVYYGRDQLSRLPLVDLERVEVLRGPQPTLFGKNAIAGAVNITSRKPSDEFEGSIRGLYEFNHKEVQLTGVISAPLTENLGLRVVGNYRDMDGYFYNTEQDRNEPNLREVFLRGTLGFDGGGPFSGSLKFEYADFDTKGQPREAFGPVGSYSAVFTGPLDVDTDLDYVRADGGYESSNNIFDVVLNMNFDLGDHTLTSTTAYVDYGVNELLDVDFIRLNFLDGTNQSEDYSQLSQELRIASPGDDQFNYIAGVYYQYSKLSVTDNVMFSPFFLATAFAPLGDTMNNRTYSQSSNLISVFAQGEVSLTDSLRFTAGARYNHESKDGRRNLAINQGAGNTFPTPVVEAVFRALNIEAHSISGSLSEDSFNPMANIQYDVTDDLLLYASYARGTKAGGFDIRSNSLPGSTTVAVPGTFIFANERADNFEAGLKFKNRNFAFNISAFRTEYDDLQVNIFDGTLNFNVRNAAGATTQGVEADARIAIGDKLTLSGAIAYLDFEFTNFPQGQCYFGQTAGADGFCDYTGQRNALTPEWSGNANADFRQPIGDSLELGLNFNVDFSSSYIASANLDPNTRQSGFAKLGARISLGTVNEGWELALIGRNLNNRRIMQTAGALPLATTITGGTGVAYSAIFDRPRNIALSASYKF